MKLHLCVACQKQNAKLTTVNQMANLKVKTSSTPQVSAYPHPSLTACAKLYMNVDYVHMNIHSVYRAQSSWAATAVNSSFCQRNCNKN